MKLQLRVLFSQVPALLVLLLSLFSGGATVARLGAQGRAVLADNYRSVLAAQRMKESIERLDSAALFRLAGEGARAEPLVARHRPAFEAELQVEEGNLTEPGEAALAARLRAAWTRFDLAYTDFLAAEPEAARRIYFERVLPEFGEVKDLADAVLSLNQDSMARKSEAAAEAAERARRSWLLSTGAGFGLAILLGLALSRRIAGPLRAFADSAERVGDGQLDLSLPATGVPELDAVSQAFHRMAERLRLYRRASDSELARAREAAQAAIESLRDPVLVLGVRGELRASNAAAQLLLGLDPTRRRLEGGDPRLLEAIDAAQQEVVREGRARLPADFGAAVLAETEAGERAFLPLATPIHDPVTGELVGVTVLLQDVTRLRRLDELKGDLVSTVAHELRTPLTSLGMALHLALDERVGGQLPARAAELVATAREDVRRLRALVDDLLDLTRLQAGRARPELEQVEARALLEAAAAAVREEAEAQQVRVQLELAPELPALAVDRRRVEVALTNLARNAVRHSPAQGRVRLGARVEGGRLRFEVDDQGPGVAVSERARIFDAFVRGAGEAGPGAGLGLHIAREVARAHGGEIGLGEAEGGGARFWIELPVAG